MRSLTSQLQAANDETAKILEKTKQETKSLLERNKMLMKVSRQERKQKQVMQREIEQLQKEVSELRQSPSTTSLPQVITIKNPTLSVRQNSRSQQKTTRADRSEELYEGVLSLKKSKAAKSLCSDTEEQQFSNQKVASYSLTPLNTVWSKLDVERERLVDKREGLIDYKDGSPTVELVEQITPISAKKPCLKNSGVNAKRLHGEACHELFATEPRPDCPTAIEDRNDENVPSFDEIQATVGEESMRATSSSRKVMFKIDDKVVSTE